MSRRNRKKKNPRIRVHIQGRKLRGIRKIQLLTLGLFAYRGFVYNIKDFPPHGTINLDTTKIRSVREYETVLDKLPLEKRNKKNKQKPHKKTYAAKIYSNLGDCSDAESLFQ